MAATVTVAETHEGRWTQAVRAGGHTLRVDEPQEAGGADLGPTPYDLLLAALGACTSMTIRMYADRKGWPLEHVGVLLKHGRVHAKDCAECETKEGMIDTILCEIVLDGALDDEQRARLLEIAGRCPVNRTLRDEVKIIEGLIGRPSPPNGGEE